MVFDLRCFLYSCCTKTDKIKSNNVIVNNLLIYPKHFSAITLLFVNRVIQTDTYTYSK